MQAIVTGHFSCILKILQTVSLSSYSFHLSSKHFRKSEAKGATTGLAWHSELCCWDSSLRVGCPFLRGQGCGMWQEVSGTATGVVEEVQHGASVSAFENPTELELRRCRDMSRDVMIRLPVATCHYLTLPVTACLHQFALQSFGSLQTWSNWDQLLDQLLDQSLQDQQLGWSLRTCSPSTSLSAPARNRNSEGWHSLHRSPSTFSEGVHFSSSCNFLWMRVYRKRDIDDVDTWWCSPVSFLVLQPMTYINDLSSKVLRFFEESRWRHGHGQWGGSLHRRGASSSRSRTRGFWSKATLKATHSYT